MAKHEFGIMRYPLKQRKRYNKYELQKYNCIVDDDYLQCIEVNFNNIIYRCYKGYSGFI